MGTTKEEAPEPTRSHDLASNTIIRRPSTPPLIDGCKRESPSEAHDEHDEVAIQKVNHFGVLATGELLEIILGHLANSSDALSTVIRTNEFFFAAGIQYIWNRADTRHLLRCEADKIRRQRYALEITDVQFWDFEEIWPSQAITCPRFPNVRSVQLYGTSLRASGPVKIIPFLGKALQDLAIWTDASPEQFTHDQSDSVWLRHVSRKCTNLTSLKLETVMDVSSTDLAAFFRAMPQLRVLRLGLELNPLLDREVVSAILVLPKLERLSMNIPLNESFVQDFVGSRSPAVIMPSITHVDIAFLNGHTLATATLLDGMSALEELTLTIRSTDEEEAAILDPAFFSVVVALPSINSVDVRLAASTTFPGHGLAAIAAHLNYLNVSFIKEDFDEGEGHVHVTGHDLLTVPISTKFLEALECLNVTSSIDVTYEQATTIAHRVMAVGERFIELFDFNVPDAASSSWPSVADYEALHVHDTIWKGSLLSFAPDPAEWTQRDLNQFTNQHGERISLDEVATGGSFNQLINN